MCRRSMAAICFAAMLISAPGIVAQDDNAEIVRQKTLRLLESRETGDFDAVREAFKPGTSMFFGEGFPLFVLPDEEAMESIIAGVEREYEKGWRYKSTVTDIDVQASDAGALATYIADYEITDPTGTVGPLTLRGTDIWVKENGDWWLKHAHWSKLETPEAKQRANDAAAKAVKARFFEVRKKWDEGGHAEVIREDTAVGATFYVGAGQPLTEYPDEAAIEEAVRRYDDLKQRGYRQTWEFEDVRVSANGDTALVTFLSKVKVTLPDDRGIRDQSLRGTEMWIKDAGTWKVFHGHWSEFE